MPAPQELAGKRYGRLTVVERVFPNSPKNDRRWRCVCDCGGESILATGHLNTGIVTSCGCRQRETSHGNFRTHGGSGTPEYSIWHGMMNRCYVRSSTRFANYGGRGIVVCDRWHDFAAFLADMGERPSDEQTIERIDNNGPYSPENCRWATRLEQAQNQRSTHLLTHGGKTQSVSAWARELGCSRGALAHRIRMGYPVHEVLCPDPRPVGRPPKASSSSSEESRQ